MSYASPEDLAQALEIRVTPDNQGVLQDCLDAAWAECLNVLVDAVWIDPNPLIKRVNVNRAVEWYKAPATYNGGIGSLDTGAMTGTMAAPTSGFGRHAAALYALTVTGASGVA